MARPIAPTPELHGEDAIAFIQAMEDMKPFSEEKKKQIQADFEEVKSWLTFDF